MKLRQKAATPRLARPGDVEVAGDHVHSLMGKDDSDECGKACRGPQHQGQAGCGPQRQRPSRPGEGHDGHDIALKARCQCQSVPAAQVPMAACRSGSRGLAPRLLLGPGILFRYAIEEKFSLVHDYVGEGGIGVELSTSGKLEITANLKQR
ncbi:Complement Receptor Type 2 [Manis pentadactyla]|nr:Complement Receptor Type 2 [Manis pentadactyla]